MQNGRPHSAAFWIYNAYAKININKSTWRHDQNSKPNWLTKKLQEQSSKKDVFWSLGWTGKNIPIQICEGEVVQEKSVGLTSTCGSFQK